MSESTILHNATKLKVTKFLEEVDLGHNLLFSSLQKKKIASSKEETF
jgi:hypothetical protein